MYRKPPGKCNKIALLIQYVSCINLIKFVLGTILCGPKIPAVGKEIMFLYILKPLISCGFI